MSASRESEKHANLLLFLAAIAFSDEAGGMMPSIVPSWSNEAIALMLTLLGIRYLYPSLRTSPRSLLNAASLIALGVALALAVMDVSEPTAWQWTFLAGVVVVALVGWVVNAWILNPDSEPRISQYAQNRPFGRAVHTYYRSQTDSRLHGPGKRRIVFHYELLNAELEDIEIVALAGEVSLNSVLIGSPTLQDRPAVVQGAPRIIDLVLDLDAESADYINSCRTEHPRTKDGRGIRYEGELWLSVRGQSTNSHSDEIKITDMPRLWND